MFSHQKYNLMKYIPFNTGTKQNLMREWESQEEIEITKPSQQSKLRVT